MNHRRDLAPSPFPGDDGQASETTRQALAAAAVDPTPTRYLGAVAALCLDRLLVPVVATATKLGQTISGLSSDKEADMAVVLLEFEPGRRGLLAFTGLDALQAWQPSARPVPVTLDHLAQTARVEDAVAVLIDVAGPHPLSIEGEVLDGLAAGRRLVELEDAQFGWLVPER